MENNKCALILHDSVAAVDLVVDESQTVESWAGKGKSHYLVLF